MQKSDNIKIETEKQLEEWAKKKGIQLTNFSINGKMIHEGYGIEKNGNLFQWYYTEKGNRETITYFYSEREAVQFAKKEILKYIEKEMVND